MEDLTNAMLSRRDLASVWHPCTQMKDHETLPLIPIRAGNGVWLEDWDGNRYIDAISSWWVNLFGHANPRIADAVIGQMTRLEHVLLAGFTHEPAVRLAERLVARAPGDLSRVFFADNGSSAVEVALKMSYHFFLNRGETRPLFVSLTNSYHGETMGALAVGDVDLYKQTYEPLLIRTLQTPVPRDQSEAAAYAAAKQLESLVSAHAREISAMIVEPLVQCAGSMHMYHPLYLTLAREICTRYGIHLIADEIAVGFGRTGTLFACEQAGVIPDFMCLSKGITGGFLPLSAVLTNETVYQAFYCDYREMKAFLHSHSYTGNPLACAAANAVLDIFETDDVLDEVRKKGERLGMLMRRFETLPTVKAVRRTGLIGAVELSGFDPQRRVGREIYAFALANGVLLRPLGNVVYFMPPYVIGDDEMEIMVDVAYRAIASLEG